MTNVCGGSVYAWSIFNAPLTQELGVVASSSMDWTLAHVVPVFSVNAACLGACTFATGKWLETVGPRAADELQQDRCREGRNLSLRLHSPQLPAPQRTLFNYSTRTKKQTRARTHTQRNSLWCCSRQSTPKHAAGQGGGDGG